MSDLSVNDATIALKGLLGISSGFGIAAEVQEEVKETKNERKNRETSSSNKKKNKKSNSNRSSSKVSVNEAATQSLENKKKTLSKGNHTTSTSSDTKPYKKKSDKMIGSKSTENFALSAFQSPPDPSTLPLPSFMSHDEDNDNKYTSNDFSTQSQREEVKINSEPVTFSANMKSSITLSTTNLSNLLSDANVSNETDTNEESKASDNCCTDEKPIFINATSHSGVDLALLTSKGSDTSRRSSLSQNPSDIIISPSTSEIDPLAVLLNKGESYGITNSALSHSNTMIHPQHSQFLPLPPYGYNMIHPNYDAYNNRYIPMQAIYPPHHHQSFTTIQVQVPPLLLPGNQMILPASPLTGGYPLPITLPENAQPGMIIPVTVPLFTNPSPYTYVNMNMTPSPHHPVYSTATTTTSSPSNYYNPNTFTLSNNTQSQFDHSTGLEGNP